jgi:outer membrane protein OmpA-like peptidoglycan-associated protein/uncharacterized protein YidB (DUF937 family)
MFEVLVREAAARFGLGDKALQVVQILLAHMTSRDRGGLFGFLEKFKAAGLGPIIQSWLGGGPSAQPISNSQLETVLGSSDGLLSLITDKLDLERDSVTSALGYLLPAIVGRLTPGGSLSAALPPEVKSLAEAGEQLLAAPAVAAPVASSGGGLSRWLPWLIVALAVVFGLFYLGQGKDGSEPAPAEPPAAAVTDEAAPAEPAPPAAGEAAAPAEPAPAAAEEAPASEAAPAQPAPATEPAEASEASEASQAPEEPASAAPAAGATEPEGAAVVALQVEERPALTVYFDVGQTQVAPDFAVQAVALVDYLKEHADVQAVISGFNDPTGDAAANEALSKNRAEAVQAALVAAGVDEARTVLEKPLEATGTGASDAASRRVEVVLRP